MIQSCTAEGIRTIHREFFLSSRSVAHQTANLWKGGGSYREETAYTRFRFYLGGDDEGNRRYLSSTIVEGDTATPRFASRCLFMKLDADSMKASNSTAKSTKTNSMSYF